MSENEGQTENGYKTLKIGGLDHLFGISVIYTSERFYGSKFYEELLFFQPSIIIFQLLLTQNPIFRI